MSIERTLEFIAKTHKRRFPESKLDTALKSNSAVIRLRAITEMKKTDFAVMCGIPFGTLSAIGTRQNDPDDRNAITKNHAQLIAAATGVCPHGLLNNKLHVPGTNREFTKNDYENHIALLKKTADWQEDCGKILIKFMQDRIIDAVCSDPPNVLLQLVSLALALDKSAKRFRKAPRDGSRYRSAVELLLDFYSDDGPASTDKPRQMRLQQLVQAIIEAETEERRTSK